MTGEPRQMMTPLIAAGVDVHGFPTACCDEHPECTHVYYCVAVYCAGRLEMDALRARVSQLTEALEECHTRDDWCARGECDTCLVLAVSGGRT